MEAWFQSWDSPSEICGRVSGTGTSIYLNNTVLPPCSYHCASTAHSASD